MRFEDYADLVCYVNLDRRPEKREFMEQQLEREGIVAHRIAGVDSAKTLPGKIDPVEVKRSEFDPQKDSTTGMLGCTYSMGLAISLAKISGAKSLLYLEDDAILCEGFKQKLTAYMAHAPENYHIINFGGWRIEDPHYFNHYFGVSSFTLNAHCMLFNESVYDLVFEALRLKTAFADYQLSNLKGVRYLVSHHFHVDQMAGFSDTTDRFIGPDEGKKSIEAGEHSEDSIEK